MAPLQLLLLILALLSLEGADAHGTVTKPAMRYNPSVTFQRTCMLIRYVQRLVTTDPLCACRRGGTVRGVRARRPAASRTQKNVLLLLHAGVVFQALRFRNSSLASGKIMLAPTENHGSMAARWSRQQTPFLSGVQVMRFRLILS